MIRTLGCLPALIRPPFRCSTVPLQARARNGTTTATLRVIYPATNLGPGRATQQVLLIENPRRGLFFGKKIGFPRRLTEAARRYHGYYFAWAIIYTFWYHPMEATSGHLIGFLYMFLLMLQGSLLFTRAHVNRWWTLVLEVAVLAHGTLVAIMQGEGMWPMFAFGFGGIFVITQMHGLGWPRWLRAVVLAAYVAGALAGYGPFGWARLSEVLRIPLIDYAAVFALAGIIGGAIGLVRLLGRTTPRAHEQSAN